MCEFVKCPVTPGRKFCAIPILHMEKSGCRIHSFVTQPEVSGFEPRQPSPNIAFYHRVTGQHTEYIWHSP